MGTIFTESFDSYSASASLGKKWNSAGANWFWGGSLGRNGNGGVGWNAAAGSHILQTQQIFGGVTTGFFGIQFYFKLSAVLPSSNAPFVGIYDGTGATAGTLNLFPSGGVGTFQLVNAGGSASVTGSKNITDGNWHHAEWQYNPANSANTNRLILDGIQEWNISANIGQGHAIQFLRFSQSNIGPSLQGLSFIHVYDNNGSSPVISDFPLGMHTIGTKRPNGDSGVTWVPDSGGTNFSRVNEVDGDGDTSYVQSGVVGNQDLYTYSPLPAALPPTRIWSAMLNSYIEDPVAGTQNYQGICKSGATQTNGAVVPVLTSYKVTQQPFNVDPNTGLPWGQAGLDAATFGGKVA